MCITDQDTSRVRQAAAEAQHHRPALHPRGLIATRTSARSGLAAQEFVSTAPLVSVTGMAAATCFTTQVMLLVSNDASALNHGLNPVLPWYNNETT